MASYSEVKSGLDQIAGNIRNIRASLANVKAIATQASGQLNAIPSNYADLIATVTAYGTSNASEAVSKTDLAKLTAEYNALKTIADAVAAINL